MRYTVKMPHLGDTSREVVVESWEAEIGASVSAGDSLLVVETDKTTTEVPSPVAGVLVERLVQEGDEVPVGAPFAVIEAR